MIISKFKPKLTKFQTLVGTLQYPQFPIIVLLFITVRSLHLDSGSGLGDQKPNTCNNIHVSKSKDFQSNLSMQRVVADLARSGYVRDKESCLCMRLFLFRHVAGKAPSGGGGGKEGMTGVGFIWLSNH